MHERKVLSVIETGMRRIPAARLVELKESCGLTFIE